MPYKTTKKVWILGVLIIFIFWYADVEPLSNYVLKPFSQFLDYRCNFFAICIKIKIADNFFCLWLLKANSSEFSKLLRFFKATYRLLLKIEYVYYVCRNIEYMNDIFGICFPNNRPMCICFLFLLIEGMNTFWSSKHW